MEKIFNKKVYKRKDTKFSPKDTLLFGMCCIAFYAMGSYICSLSSSASFFSSCFCPGFGADFSLSAMLAGWLFAFLPVLIAFLCGYSYLGSMYSAVLVAFRSYLSGYSCFAVLPSCINLSGGILLFSLYTFAEGLILLTLVSASVEQKRFRLCYCISKSTPFAFGIGKIYFKNFMLRVGVLFFVFLLRTVICSFFN